MESSTIIFDGECNLCNGVIGWIVKLAPANSFAMVPFQSPLGQELLRRHGFPTHELTTVILLDAMGVHTRSDGFLRIVSQIPGWNTLALLLTAIPKIVRDGIYIIASKNRVRWFGKSQACALQL